MNSRLTFRPDLGLTSREIADSSTAYVAEAHGVRYRIVGTLVPGARARRFRAYRVAGVASLPKYFPAAVGGEHKTRGAARDQAERDLAAVLADREQAAPVVAKPTPAAAEWQQFPGRALRAPEVAAPGPFRRVEQAVEIIEQVIRDLTADKPSPEVDPATTDTVPELVDRVVRRAQYEALKAALAVLAGWVEGVQENNASIGIGDPVMFHVDDIRQMLNDTARELGTAPPWRPTDA